MSASLEDLCSLCDRLVLGLSGQDWSVLPWMLGSAGGEVPLGPCHVRCLHEAGVARTWAEAVRDYHHARWPAGRSGVADGVGWRLHAGPRARRLHLWRTDGRLASFPFAAVNRAGDGPLRLTTELAESGSDHGTVLLAAMSAGESATSADAVPLADVLAALDLTDRYPYAAGTVSRRRANADLVIAEHPLHLDLRCRYAARELIRASG